MNYIKAKHIPTGKLCTVMNADGDRCFCNFGQAATPFTWVKTTELEFLEQPMPKSTCNKCADCSCRSV